MSWLRHDDGVGGEPDEQAAGQAPGDHLLGGHPPADGQSSITT